MPDVPPLQFDRALILERELRVAQLAREQTQARLFEAQERVYELESELLAQRRESEQALALAAEEPARLRQELARSEARRRAAEQLAWAERAEREALEEELRAARRRSGGRGRREAQAAAMRARIDELQDVVVRLERSLAEAEHAEAARTAAGRRGDRPAAALRPDRDLVRRKATGPASDTRIQVDRLAGALERLRATVDRPADDFLEDLPGEPPASSAIDSPT